MGITSYERDWQIYLQPTQFIDSDSPAVMEFTQSIIDHVETDIERGVKLYYVVRDMIRYSIYGISFDPGRYKASWVLREKIGFCVQKAILLAAAARAAGIPSRLGYADVRNHLATERLIETGERIPTQKYNGYGEYVAHLYE